MRRPSWSIVSTVDAPLWLLDMHSRFLAVLGCHKILYFLDNPHRYAQSDLAVFPAMVDFVRCDETYWAAQGPRPPTIIGRQITNLRHAKGLLDDDFILHIDADEFPMFARDVADILAELPDDVGSLRIQNVERVLIGGGTRWIDGILRMPVTKRAWVEEVYGERSRYLGLGLASYIHGKSFTRIRDDVVASVHGEFRQGRDVSRALVPLKQALLVHYDCISPTHWKWKLLMRAQERGKGRKMFAHEWRMLDDVMDAADPAAAVSDLVMLMHSASAEEARRWLRAGVARPLPQTFTQRLAGSAGDSRFLALDFADRSLAEFYAVPADFVPVRRPA